MPVSQILSYDIDDGGRAKGWGDDAEEEDEYIKKQQSQLHQL